MIAIAEGLTLEDTALAELAAGLRGQIVGRDDPGYEEHRKIWNGSIDRRPALIVRCAGVADVVAAVKFARAHGLPVAVRSGGHSFPGFSVADDAFVIDLGPMNLQPSEFGRLALALVLAMFFAENRRGAANWGDLAIAGGFLAVLAGLVAKQPDLGTAVTLIPVFVGAAFAAGMRLKVLAVLALVAVFAAPVAWTFALKDYQKSRIQTFLDPEQDSRGAGYQQIQARITVGSGGLTGKGYLQGTQGQYKFLPVAHNDFIYSVLGEELGFVGVIATLGLYLLVILRSLDAARLAKDRLGAYLVAGLITGFTFQVLYNITMSAGLAPVKGLTLPLMSYGGSSIIATLACFGLILNVRMRRFTN